MEKGVTTINEIRSRRINNIRGNSIEETIFYVKGMHCPSCEVLIEKKIVKLKGVKSVEVSLQKGRVVIEHTGRAPSLDQLNNIFQRDDYTFSVKPLSKDGKGNNQIDYLKIVAAIVLAGGLYLFLDSLGIAKMVSVDAKSALPAFMLLGIVAGLSSCAALVGGIILSMSKQWESLYSNSEHISQRLQPHLLFNAGRILSYAVFGALLGLVGEAMQPSISVTSFMTIAVSVAMVAFGLQMLGVKYFQKFQFTMPRFVTRYVADETNFQGRYMPFAMGGLTFFLPCGFTITAQGLALISGSAIQGSLIMLFFALGTLPMLMIIGVSSVKFMEKPHLSNAFLKVAGVIVLFFALYNINNQMVVLGAPSFADITQISDTLGLEGANGNTSLSNLEFPPIVDGKQIIKMEVSARGYSPNAFKVRKGVPVLWEITDAGSSGCTNAIISQSLFDGQISLTPGETVNQEFTPNETGRFRFSCWMGMVTGVIGVVDEDNPQSFSGIDETKQSTTSQGCACCAN